MIGLYIRARLLGHLVVAAPVVAALVLVPVVARADAAQTFDARGVIVSISADRQLVNIAHEKIEGYMNAMTMTFEARSIAQTDGLTSGDRVSFSFTATSDGRRLIDSIARRQR